MCLILFPGILPAEQNWKAVMRYDKQAAKADLSKRLQKYAGIDSHIAAEQSTVPSTKQQAAFAKDLAKELKHMGASNVQVSKTGIVTAEIPATTRQPALVLALVAHLDTPAQTKAQTPQSHAKYVKGDLVLNKEKGIRLTEENSSQLLRAHGHDFLTADGLAPFGASSKAGLSIVMNLADYLLGNRSLQHGLIKIILLPDGPSHAGAEALDIAGLKADYAYVLAGSDLGEIANSNFNGRNFTAIFKGRRDVPLGQAISSNFADNVLMASDFHTLLPRYARPETTSGQQGFVTVDSILTQGNLTTVTGQIRAFNNADLQNLTNQVSQAFNIIKSMYSKRAGAELSFQDVFSNVQGKMQADLLTHLEAALDKQDISAKYISVRDNPDFAVLTSRGLPAVGFFTGVFHEGEPLEYADVDIMEASQRALLEDILN